MDAAQARRVDEFIRNGRLGPALVYTFNQSKSGSFGIADFQFGAFRGDDGIARLFAAAHGKRLNMRIGKLYLITPDGRGVTEEESAFFRQLGIGWK